MERRRDGPDWWDGTVGPARAGAAARARRTGQAEPEAATMARSGGGRGRDGAIACGTYRAARDVPQAH